MLKVGAASSGSSASVPAANRARPVIRDVEAMMLVGQPLFHVHVPLNLEGLQQKHPRPLPADLRSLQGGALTALVIIHDLHQLTQDDRVVGNDARRTSTLPRNRMGNEALYIRTTRCTSIFIVCTAHTHPCILPCCCRYLWSTLFFRTYL